VIPRSGAPRWSQTYERDWRDIFEIQAEITRAVASSLTRQLRLEPTERAPQEMRKHIGSILERASYEAPLKP